MKTSNLFVRFFVAFLICTVAFLGVAAYATEKVLEADPQAMDKIQDNFKDRFHVALFMTGMSHAKPEKLENSQDKWSLAVPSDDIKLHFYSGRLSVKKTTGKEVVITATGVLDKNQAPRLLTVDGSSSQITVKQPDQDAARELHVEIEIPESFTQNLEIKTVSGEVVLEQLKLKELEINAVSSSIDLNGVQAQSLEAKTVSGDIASKDISITKIDGKSVSGKFQLQSQINSDIEWKSVSGNVALTMPETHDTHFQLKSTSGNIDNKYGSTSHSPAHQVLVKTVSGDISIQ